MVKPYILLQIQGYAKKKKRPPVVASLLLVACLVVKRIKMLRMSPWWSLCRLRCIHRMPGGVIVGDSGPCCCGPAFNVMCQ